MWSFKGLATVRMMQSNDAQSNDTRNLLMLQGKPSIEPLIEDQPARRAGTSHNRPGQAIARGGCPGFRAAATLDAHARVIFSRLPNFAKFNLATPRVGGGR